MAVPPRLGLTFLGACSSDPVGKTPSEYDPLYNRAILLSINSSASIIGGSLLPILSKTSSGEFPSRTALLFVFSLFS
jgi:hypothetical protein